MGVKVPDGFGGVWLSDDDSTIVSAEVFREFVVPYNSKVLKAFDGGCIHYCGNSTQNIENYCNTDGLTSVNNLHLDNIEAAVELDRGKYEPSERTQFELGKKVKDVIDSAINA